MNYNIIGIRENPGYTEQAIQYFSERWGIDERIYRDCIINSLATPNKLPRFYLMIEASRVIGGYGLNEKYNWKRIGEGIIHGII